MVTRRAKAVTAFGVTVRIHDQEHAESLKRLATSGRGLLYKRAHRT
jgi:hypothetical protein